MQIKKLDPKQLQKNGQLELASSNWIAIQRYVESALLLPTDNLTLENWLRAPPPEDMSDMLSIYKNIHKHCTYWKDETYPKVVAAATDIHDYALKAKTYLAPLIPLANKLEENPDDESAQKKFLTILDTLMQDAETYKQRAEAASSDVKSFKELTRADSLSVKTLQARYSEKYSNQSKEQKRLEESAASLRASLEKTQKEYDHNVVVAATTPTYAWLNLPPLPPFGAIAAAIVAGLYGKWAADNKAQMDKLRKEVAATDKAVLMAIRITSALRLADESVKNIRDNIEDALRALESAQGVWAAMSDNLKNVKRILEQDIKKAPYIIVDLGVEQAIEQWQEIKCQADAFRKNAYITVKAEAA